jgi:ribosomal protein S18 acetylase RimI-like enzyme
VSIFFRILPPSECPAALPPEKEMRTFGRRPPNETPSARTLKAGSPLARGKRPRSLSLRSGTDGSPKAPTVRVRHRIAVGSKTLALPAGEAEEAEAERFPPPVVLTRRLLATLLKSHTKWVGAEGDAILAQSPVGAVTDRRLQQALALMDQELGHAFDAVGDRAKAALFYVDRNHRVLGVAVTEQIDTAYLLDNDARRSPSPVPFPGKSMTASSPRTRRMADASNGKVAASPPPAQVWAEKAHSCKSPLRKFEWCICGISRIWVHRSFRRRGIATALLDTARSTLVYGFVFPKQQVAFSQPTIDGKLLALRYTGTPDLMVYE